MRAGLAGLAFYNLTVPGKGSGPEVCDVEIKDRGQRDGQESGDSMLSSSVQIARKQF